MTIFGQYVNQVKETLDRVPWSRVEQVVDILYAAWRHGRQVYVMGNGGSASTASHMACDLGKNTALPGTPRLRVMSLNDNMATFSAHSNDNGYEHVFAEQLANFLRAGDVVIAISASGNSPNVLNAVKYGREHGATTIGLSGYAGGALAQLVDLSVVVPSHNIEQIEDIHLMLEHMITVALRRALREPEAVGHVVALNGSNGAVLHRAPYIMQAADR
jgi:D-sedoheptulose 7-phosphate isomerase